MTREYGRKSYLADEDDDYVTRMRRVPRKAMQDQVAAPYSEMDKPYLVDSYAEQEHFQPPPYPLLGLMGWPSWAFPSFPGPVPTDPAWGGGFVGCSISCSSNYVGKDCDRPISCGWLALTPPETVDRWKVFKDGVLLAMARISLEGGVSPIKIYPVAGTWDTYLDAGKEKVDLVVRFYDAGGSICEEEVTMWCPCCPAAATFEFDDDNTPDTIVAGSNIMVCVNGGCPPFTYNVSGTGYTWNVSGTNQHTTDSRCAQLDCAAGT